MTLLFSGVGGSAILLVLIVSFLVRKFRKQITAQDYREVDNEFYFMQSEARKNSKKQIQKEADQKIAIEGIKNLNRHLNSGNLFAQIPFENYAKDYDLTPEELEELKATIKLNT